MTPNPVGGAPAGTNAKDALNLPSVFLMVFGGLGILFSLFGLAGGGARSLGPLANDPRFAQLLAMQGGPMRFVMPALGVALSAFIIFGAMKMRNLQSHGIAMAAAIVAMIPCGGCCCLPLPLGIWALVTLMKPEIKSQFQG